MTGSSPWWCSQAARRASCWCSRGQAVAVAVPYREVSVTVVDRRVRPGQPAR